MELLLSEFQSLDFDPLLRLDIYFFEAYLQIIVFNLKSNLSFFIVILLAKSLLGYRIMDNYIELSFKLGVKILIC